MQLRNFLTSVKVIVKISWRPFTKCIKYVRNLEKHRRSQYLKKDLAEDIKISIAFSDLLQIVKLLKKSDLGILLTYSYVKIIAICHVRLLFFCHHKIDLIIRISKKEIFTRLVVYYKMDFCNIFFSLQSDSFSTYNTYVCIVT